MFNVKIFHSFFFQNERNVAMSSLAVGCNQCWQLAHAKHCNQRPNCVQTAAHWLFPTKTQLQQIPDTYITIILRGRRKIDWVPFNRANALPFPSLSSNIVLVFYSLLAGSREKHVLHRHVTPSGRQQRLNELASPPW